MNTDHRTATAATNSRAYTVVDDLMARVGVDGLTAALSSPGLLAAVDQEATAVLLTLRRAKRPLSLTTLAAYARSLVSAAHRHGRAVPEPGEAVAPHLHWDSAPRYLVRMVAICGIAEERGWL